MMTRLINLYIRAKNALDNQKGQGMAEYGLILVLVAVFVYGAFQLLGQNIDATVKDIAGKIKSS